MSYLEPDHDFDAGKMWLEKAIAQGNIEAENQMAWSYEFGMNVEKDESRARELYYRAAEQGSPLAQLALAAMYGFKDDPSDHDKEEMVKWAQIAANNGSFFADEFLGDLYARRGLVKRDYARAATWYERAARLGQPDSQQKLGQMYEQGQGVKKDLVAAYALYKAVSLAPRFTIVYMPGQAPADMDADRKRLVRRLSKLQLAKGDALASTWKVGMDIPIRSCDGGEEPKLTREQQIEARGVDSPRRKP